LAAISARYEPIPGRAPCSFPDSSVWPDALSLLFEIKRLRSMVLRVYQLKAGMKSPTMAMDDLLVGLLEDLDKEPCVLELTTLAHAKDLASKWSQPKRKDREAS
jgi:hypothetical protein